MAVMMSDEPVYNADELAAYYAGRDAKRAGKDFFDKPYPYDPRGDNGLSWAWQQGFLDEENGTPLEATLEALRNGENV